MSVADAKESIGLGGSLKERMAALQGKNSFSGAAPAPPKPATEKPKWKPPPVVSPPADDEEEPSHELGAEEGKDPVVPQATPDNQKEEGQADESQETKEPDEEDEERERRAAIAARMARLGGARIGMGPPVFGIKPKPAPKPSKSSTSESVVTPSEDGTGAPLDKLVDAEGAEGTGALFSIVVE